MKTNIFLPNKINVGFQERQDTYTKKLAYIVYYDEEGKLRKESSWENWRDKDLGNEIFENEPISGFVLNKKVGGYSTGWNHRQTSVRVYDPRGFEFEITVTNLLYILENTNSIKGKGLEGEFVYGWDKTELVLIPIGSPDYKEMSRYNKIVHNKVKLKGKDLKVGATYLTKDNEEWVYLGRFDLWETDYENTYVGTDGEIAYKQITKGKAYFFKYEVGLRYGIETVKTLSSKFIGVVSENSVDNYAELFELLERDRRYSPLDRSKDEYRYYTKQEIQERFDIVRWMGVYTEGREKIDIRCTTDGIYYYEKPNPEYTGWSSREPATLKVEFSSLDELIEAVRPMYMQTYLQNGKIYGRG